LSVIACGGVFWAYAVLIFTEYMLAGSHAVSWRGRLKPRAVIKNTERESGL
jgi:hypothetical protein